MPQCGILFCIGSSPRRLLNGMRRLPPVIFRPPARDCSWLSSGRINNTMMAKGHHLDTAAPYLCESPFLLRLAGLLIVYCPPGCPPPRFCSVMLDSRSLCLLTEPPLWCLIPAHPFPLSARM